VLPAPRLFGAPAMRGRRGLRYLPGPGVEKLKDTGYGGLPATTAFGQMQALVGPNATAPGLFAQLATSYFAKYQVDPKLGRRPSPTFRQEPCQRSLESKAHLRKAVAEEQIINAP